MISPIAAIEGVRRCPVSNILRNWGNTYGYVKKPDETYAQNFQVGEMKLCVTSEAEFTKCVRMSTALRAQVILQFTLTVLHPVVLRSGFESSEAFRSGFALNLSFDIHVLRSFVHCVSR